jgi:hypothetical protein
MTTSKKSNKSRANVRGQRRVAKGGPVTKDSKDDGATFHWEADWDYWKCMPTLTAVEGVALMSGVKPELVDPGDLFYSSLLVEHQRLEIAKRRFPAKQYPDGVPKALFLEWIAEMEETSPALWKNLHPKFRECFLKNPPLAAAATTTPKNTASEAIPGDVRQPTTEGHLEEPASAAPKLAAEEGLAKAASTGDRLPSTKDRPPNKSKRRCLLRAIVALAKANSINLDDITVAAGAIEKHTQTFGKPVSASAIRHYLHSAMDLGIWPKPAAGYRSDDEPGPESQHDQEETRNLLTVFVALAKAKGISLESHGIAGDSVAKKTVGSVDRPVCTKTIQGYIRQAEDLGILPKPKGHH